MFKLLVLPLFFILTACNLQERNTTIDENISLYNAVYEFKNMSIGQNYTRLKEEGIVKQVADTEVVDGCLYAETKDENVFYLVFDNKISTASYQKSKFIGLSVDELKSKIKDLSLIKSAYDDNTYYLQYQFDSYNGVRFYISENKVVEVTYGILDKLQYQEGCA